MLDVFFASGTVEVMMLAVSCVRVGKSALHGWGVFAAVDIPAGFVVEEAPVLVLPTKEWEQVSCLHHYVFEWAEGEVAVALGSVSLYNHSSSPSAVVEVDVFAGVARVLALRDVRAGEELLIEYASADEMHLWGICSAD